jgi:hypothetical protein
MENKTGHLSNVRSHRKQPFRMVEIREFEVPLSANSGHSRYIYEQADNQKSATIDPSLRLAE